MKPSFVFDNKRHFIDITDERTRIKYQDVEEVGGYRFRHVKYGIFAAAPSFQITKKDMRAILEEYSGVYFVVEGEYRYSDPDDKVFRVVFAFSATTLKLQVEVTKLTIINITKIILLFEII